MDIDTHEKEYVDTVKVQMLILIVTSAKVSGSSFKRLMKTNYASKLMRQIFHMLCTDQSLCDMFLQLHVSKLANVGALIPVSTAECEGAFSSMNLIKTDLRNRSTLDCLMRISTEGPRIGD